MSAHQRQSCPEGYSPEMIGFIAYCHVVDLAIQMPVLAATSHISSQKTSKEIMKLYFEPLPTIKCHRTFNDA